MWSLVPGFSTLWSMPWSRAGLTHRAVAARLPDGRLLLSGALPQNGAWEPPPGEVGYVLASSTDAVDGLRAAHTAHPGAALVCHPAVTGLIEARTGLFWRPLDALLGALAEGQVSLLRPPGLRSGAVWPVIRENNRCAWIVTDAIRNHPAAPRGLAAARFHGFHLGPGLLVSESWVWRVVEDRTRFTRWLLDTLDAIPPTDLVVGHGELVSAPRLPERLRDVTRRALPWPPRRRW